MTELFREEIAEGPAGSCAGCTSASTPGDGVTVAEPVGSALRHVTIAAQLLAPVLAPHRA